VREPHEIRKQVLILRDKHKLTMTVLCERARISRHDLWACFNMRASESTLQKLDAFLDAPKLHQRPREQTLMELHQEKLSREVWLRFKLKTKHPLTIAQMSHDQQRAYYNETTKKAKFFLQKQILKIYGLVVKVPDGATYWQYKKRCLHRIRGEEALRTGDRDSRRVPWPRPIREERPL
jgi:hypothetical protein